MTKQQRIENLEQELSEYKKYATDLKARCDKSYSVISDIAQGYGVKGDYNWQTAMQKLAANGLVQIAGMTLRRPSW